MKKKSARVPPLRSSRRVPDVYVEIPTAGRNVEALASTIGQFVKGGHLVRSVIYHDADCPCTQSGRPMSTCTCEIVGLRLQYLDSLADRELGLA
jgi:hypothetical protein